MSKRSREEVKNPKPRKKQNTGFSVGPANLPDGTYRRKTQKIKNNLIQKAKVRKAYARIKAREEEEEQDQDEAQLKSKYNPYTVEGSQQDLLSELPSTTFEKQHGAEIHPARQAMLNEPSSNVSRNPNRTGSQKSGSLGHSPPNDKANDNQFRRGKKSDAYSEDFALAEERKAHMEARELRREEREKERRAMAKARRPGRDGKQKLGRQSTVLLGRIRRMIGDGEA